LFRKKKETVESFQNHHKKNLPINKSPVKVSLTNKRLPETFKEDMSQDKKNIKKEN